MTAVGSNNSREQEIQAALRIFESTFPEHVRQGVWRDRSPAFAKMTQLGKSDWVSIEELYLEQPVVYKNAITLIKQAQQKTPTTLTQAELQSLSDAFGDALQRSHDAGIYLIHKMFEQGQSEKEVLRAYRRIARMLDESSNLMIKIRPLADVDMHQELKANEFAQRHLRSIAIEEIVKQRLAAESKNSNQWWDPTAAPGYIVQVRAEVVSQVLLLRIKGINPRNEHLLNADEEHGGTVTIAQLRKREANNRTYNCVRVVPAALGSLFGGKVKAVAALDDENADLPMRTGSTHAYEKIYGGKFAQYRDLNELFDALESTPNGTFGILRHSNVGWSEGHVTVVGKVNGVVCIIEAQTAQVITRDPISKDFSYKAIQATRDEKYRFHDGPYSPTRIADLQFMEVHLSLESVTEFDRAAAATSFLHRDLEDPWYQQGNLRSTFRPSGPNVPPEVIDHVPGFPKPGTGSDQRGMPEPTSR